MICFGQLKDSSRTEKRSLCLNLRYCLREKDAHRHFVCCHHTPPRSLPQFMFEAEYRKETIREEQPRPLTRRRRHHILWTYNTYAYAGFQTPFWCKKYVLLLGQRGPTTYATLKYVTQLGRTAEVKQEGLRVQSWHLLFPSYFNFEYCNVR